MTQDKLAEALKFLDRVNRGMISGRINEWPGLREACGVVYAAHAAAAVQPQANDVMLPCPCGCGATAPTHVWNGLAASPRQQATEAVAWLANDGTGRVVDAKAKSAGERSGGATASATAIYSTPLYVHPVAQDAEMVARRFHKTYERLAPKFGYETREETRQFDPASPNGKLMIAVCEEMVREAHDGK